MFDAFAGWIERTAIDAQNGFQRLIALDVQLDRNRAAYRQPRNGSQRLRIEFDLRCIDISGEHT